MLLPALKVPTVRLLRGEAVGALQDIRARVGAEAKDKGVHVRLFMIVSKDFECPADLLELNEFWVHGPANFTERRRFEMFTFEKGLRLAAARWHLPHCISAFEAFRDRTLHRYGGAICVECLVQELGRKPVWLILSVSGLSELLDEAVAVRLAQRLPWSANQSQLQRIVALSKNITAQQLLAAAA